MWNPCRKRWSFLPFTKSASGTWVNIARLIEKLKFGDLYFKECLKGKCGDGSSIRFWLDCWILDGPIKDKFPRLYILDRSKDCLVRDKWVGDTENGYWSLRLNLQSMSEEEATEWVGLQLILQSVKLNARSDGWSWVGIGDESFSVQAVKKSMQDHRSYGEWFRYKWINWVPLKCNILAWRAEMNRLPTALALARRNVFVNDQVCSLCNFDFETSEHLFTGCGFSNGVWSSIASWCGINNIFAFEIRDLLEWHKFFQGDKRGKLLIQGIIIVSFWEIWGARNKKIFNNKVPKVQEVVRNIKSSSFFWVKHRSRFKNIEWKDWVLSPLYML